MGWFSAIKRVFTHSSKQKLNESEKKSTKEKKKKNGFGNSFIPLFGEPSSIEKILGDVEREQALNFRPPANLVPSPRAASPRRTASSPRVSSSQRINSFRAASPIITSPKNASPKAASARITSPRVASARITTPKVASTRITSSNVASSSGVARKKQREISKEPTISNQHASATRIQAAFRGYMARKSFRALKGLVRLQAVVRGQNVKRQTMNAMKQMQLLVRVQAQIHSQRIHRYPHQTPQIKYDKEAESSLGKWNFSQTSEAGNQEDWDDSLLTKEQVDANMHRKMEAAIKRQRASAYAYSQHSKSTKPPIFNNNFGRFPWSWNSLQRGIPQKTIEPQTATYSIPESSNNYKQHPSYSDAVTPMSTKSAFAPIKSLTKQYPKPRKTSAANSVFDQKSLRDDDSLMSCPSFSVPSYMSPTMSTKAKSRQQIQGIESKRRLSYPFAKGSNYNQSVKTSSIDNMSVANSLSSVSTAFGRKPFNRFV